jgi:Flp pilus assembly protein CpaB
MEAEISGGPKQGVLVVLRALAPGEQIKHTDLAEREIPQAYVTRRSISAADRQRVTGLRVASNLQAQDPLFWSDLVDPGEEQRKLSGLVQPGRRAFVVQASGRSAHLAEPGDRVDVVATFTQQENSEHRVSAVLLQNVLVLGRGSSPQNGAAAATDGRDLALSVTLSQAQVLAAAAERGTFSVALRSPEDVNVQDGVADVNSRIFAEADKRAAAVGGAPGPARLSALPNR